MIMPVFFNSVSFKIISTLPFVNSILNKLWDPYYGVPHNMGINTFPKSLKQLNYANFNAI